VLATAKVQVDKFAALRDCLASVRRGGTVSLSGVYAGPMPMFMLGELFDRQIQLHMGQANVHAWTDEIVPLLADGDPFATDDLVTHVLPLAEAPRGYELFQNKLDGCVKVVLRP
jgi:threonine dehydrogenase-like Zn-dependent dehydrogenase